MTDWIIELLTRADADRDGDVVASTSPSLCKELWRYEKWHDVTPGWPWRHTDFWTPPTPAPESAPAAPEPEPEPEEDAPPEPVYIYAERATRGFAWFSRVNADQGHAVEEYAVATDGTAWWRFVGKDDCLEDKEWVQIRPLPQPGEE